MSTLASCVLFGIFCHVLNTGTRMRREHSPDGDNYQKSRSSLQIDAFSQHSLSLPRISAPPISAGERRLAREMLFVVRQRTLPGNACKAHACLPSRTRFFLSGKKVFDIKIIKSVKIFDKANARHEGGRKRLLTVCACL